MPSILTERVCALPSCNEHFRLDNPRREYCSDSHRALASKARKREPLGPDPYKLLALAVACAGTDLAPRVERSLELLASGDHAAERMASSANGGALNRPRLGPEDADPEVLWCIADEARAA